MREEQDKFLEELTALTRKYRIKIDCDMDGDLFISPVSEDEFDMEYRVNEELIEFSQDSPYIDYTKYEA